MRRIAIATCREHARYHDDDLPLIHAMPAAGLHPEPCVWNDPALPWESYDAILVRTIWDYYQHYPEYLAWLGRLESVGVPVINPVATLRWNADKRYLLDLEAAGIPVIATRLVEAATLPGVFDDCGWDDVVIKPAVSAGAWDTLRVQRGAAMREAARFREMAQRHRLLVQPYVAQIATAGEWSLLFFGGEYSHALLKRPASGDFRVQEKHGGKLLAATPPESLRAQAEAIVHRLPGIGHPGCLYARVDGVEVDGRLQLMELELIEPQLFLAGREREAAHFARRLAESLRRAA